MILMKKETQVFKYQYSFVSEWVDIYLDNQLPQVSFPPTTKPFGYLIGFFKSYPVISVMGEPTRNNNVLTQFEGLKISLGILYDNKF